MTNKGDAHQNQRPESTLDPRFPSLSRSFALGDLAFVGCALTLMGQIDDPIFAVWAVGVEIESNAYFVLQQIKLVFRQQMVAMRC